MLGISVPGFDAAPAQVKAAALDALDAVGLRDLASRLYVHLSGGERQRVHIARALSQLAAPPYHPGKTRCFLLDEPTSSLDLAHQSLVLAAIRRQARSGAAIVAVFHDLNLAAALADELVLLEKGRIMAARPGQRGSPGRSSFGSLRLPGADQSHARRGQALCPAAGYLPSLDAVRHFGRTESPRTQCPWH